MINTNTFDRLLFCDIQIAHYSQLLRRRARGWQFKAAFFAWNSLQYYKRLRKRLTPTSN